jgi:hypothetical protein
LSARVPDDATTTPTMLAMTSTTEARTHAKPMRMKPMFRSGRTKRAMLPMVFIRPVSSRMS